MAMSFSLSLCLSVRPFVYLSPVKFVKSFATWQHLRQAGVYRIDSDTLVYDYEYL